VSLIYAVITGDVVNSALVDNYQDKLDESFSSLPKKYDETIMPYEVDRYSGDQFQILLDRPAKSLHMSLYIYASLFSPETSIETRLSIGLGEVENIREKVSMGEGPAFRISGTNLNKMEEHQRIYIDTDDDTAPLFQGASDLLSSILLDLTPKQAETVQYKLQEYNQSEISEKLGISNSSVWNRLKSAKWKYIKSFLDRFEQYETKIKGKNT
jgi:predicted DNA-binding protein (UPF0251 family)